MSLAEYQLLLLVICDFLLNVSHVKMEQWERDIITENLSKLIKITDCNTLLLTELRKTVLGLEDMEYLEDISIKLKRAKALYDLIVKKHNGFRILIETFLEPELSQDAPAILLITKAKEKGKGHGLPKLPSQNLSSTTTPDTVDSSPPTQGGNERQVQAQLPEELEKFVCKGKELTVNVIQPNEQALTEKTQSICYAKEKTSHLFSTSLK
ncbi:hypothetical protein Ocin01_12386 [Orchesella cincta]|uniref:Uncharacterized protein n=1 Tax=Orchesella cincta TaxID=48709 RepID=A0A1D2MN72_ORCCI|nr:hypothetical protein Ocin01_12386 [Orchesella cincta]